jgi:hypothetical protein
MPRGVKRVGTLVVPKKRGRPPKPEAPPQKEKLPVLLVQVVQMYGDNVTLKVEGYEGDALLSYREFALCAMKWGYSPSTGGKYPGKVVSNRFIVGW